VSRGLQWPRPTACLPASSRWRNRAGPKL